MVMISPRKVNLLSNPEVDTLFDHYPKRARKKIERLRQLIIETADETDGVVELEETLKWGEPSYLTKSGSTIRIDWKERSPDQYAIYFKCTSRLVPTFREVYADVFTFEGNRAIVFTLEQTLPVQPLKNCIKAALKYHQVKRLPTLGL